MKQNKKKKKDQMKTKLAKHALSDILKKIYFKNIVNAKITSDFFIVLIQIGFSLHEHKSNQHFNNLQATIS